MLIDTTFSWNGGQDQASVLNHWHKAHVIASTATDPIVRHCKALLHAAALLLKLQRALLSDVLKKRPTSSSLNVGRYIVHPTEISS